MKLSKRTNPMQMLDDIVTAVGGIRKVRFCKRSWTFQFAIPAIKLGIELDPGFIARLKWDKYNAATIAGWSFMRFTAHEVRCGIAKEMIGKFIEGKIKEV